MYSSKQIAMFIACAALFMEAVDGTIINIAIPAMSRSLLVSPVDLKVTLISYFLSLAIFIPVSGWLVDKYGIKRLFLAALIFFTLSSLWCGFVQHLSELVVARTLQGVGGAMIIPIGRLIILRVFERHEIIGAISKIAMVGALGTMLGPVLGGMITHYFSWRWIFWVNVPIGLVTGMVVICKLPSVSIHKPPPLDKLGFILFGMGLAGLTFGLSSLSENTISPTLSFLIVSISFVLLLSYVMHCAKSNNPLTKIELFRLRSFRISMIGNLISRIGFGGMPFLLPILLQIGLGYSAQIVGLLLAPLAFGTLLAKPLTLKAIRFFKYRRLLLLNTILVALSIWSFVVIDAHTPMYFVAMLTFVYGFLVSMQYGGMNSLAYTELTSSQMSAATSIASTVGQLSHSFGIAISAILIHVFTLNIEAKFIVSQVVLHRTFYVMGVIMMAAIPVFWRLSQQDGRKMFEMQIVSN